jgi:hypothetical protein
MNENKKKYYILFSLVFLVTSCSITSITKNSNTSCSPSSETRTLIIQDVKYEFNVVLGESNSHLYNNFNALFYPTDFTEPFIKDRIDQLGLSDEDIKQLYNLELFILKNENRDLTVEGDLLSAIVHFIDEKNLLSVRYYEIINNSISEIKELRANVPYISSSASYLNFLSLENQGFSVSDVIFYNEDEKKISNINNPSFSTLLANFKKEKGLLPESWVDD